MLLWCISQHGKPFDNLYLMCQISSYASLLKLKRLVDPVDHTSLTQYICTTLTALALAQQFPAEVGCLFFEPLTCYQGDLGTHKSISELTPTDLKEYLLAAGLFDEDPKRSMKLKKVEIKH